jgi:hypothetical protein
MQFRGWLRDVVAAAVASVVLVVAGWYAAQAYVGWWSEHSGATTLVMTSPNEYLVAVSSLPLALGLAPLWGWLATLLYRALSRQPPTLGVFGAATLPTVLCAVGALAAAYRNELAAADVARSDLDVSFAVGDFALGWVALRWSLFGAVLALGLAGYLGRKARAPAALTSG